MPQEDLSFFLQAPKCWCLASSSSASLIPSECSRNLIPLQFTFSLRIPQEYGNGLCDFSLWVPGPCIQPPPPQFLACMSQLFTTRLGGLPHRPHFFVGLPSSEESTATPPVRQALNSVVIWNTSSPYASSFHPAPRLTRMCRPDPVHRDNRNFPAGLATSTSASSNDLSRGQPVSDHRKYSGRSRTCFPHSREAHMSSALASRALPTQPCLPLWPQCASLCTGRRVPLARRLFSNLLSPMNAVPLIAWFKHHGRETSGVGLGQGPLYILQHWLPFFQSVFCQRWKLHICMCDYVVHIFLPYYHINAMRTEICLFQFIHHRIHNAGHTARHKQVVN